VCEKSQENQNGAENTNRENRRIQLLSQFGLLLALNFQLFGMVTAYNDGGTKTKPVFGHISLSLKDVHAEKEKISLSLPSSWLPSQPRGV